MCFVQCYVKHKNELIYIYFIINEVCVKYVIVYVLLRHFALNTINEANNSYPQVIHRLIHKKSNVVVISFSDVIILIIISEYNILRANNITTLSKHIMALIFNDIHA